MDTHKIQRPVSFFLGRTIFGRILTLAREEAKKTQGDIAHAIGVKGHNTISYIERGLMGCPRERVEAYAKAVNLDPGDMLRWHLVCQELDNGTSLRQIDFFCLLSRAVAGNSGGDHPAGSAAAEGGKSTSYYRPGDGDRGRPVPTHADLEELLIHLIITLTGSLSSRPPVDGGMLGEVEAVSGSATPAIEAGGGR